MAYPKLGAGTHQKQLYYRDINFYNYHFQHDKMRYLLGLDIIDAHKENRDFCSDISEGDVWTINRQRGEGSSGWAAPACIDEVNGVVRVDPGNAANDYEDIARQNECWKLVACYPLYLEMRLRVNDVANVILRFGLFTGNDSVFNLPNDYLMMQISDNAYILGQSSKDGTSSQKNLVDEDGDNLEISADTWYRWGFHFDGKGKVTFFVFQDGDRPQTLLGKTNITSHIPDDEELRFAFGLMNRSAGDDNYADFDYVKIAQRRVIE